MANLMKIDALQQNILVFEKTLKNISEYIGKLESSTKIQEMKK